MKFYLLRIKSIVSTQLLASVANTLRRFRLEERDRTYHKDFENMGKEKTADLLKANEELRGQQIELKELNTFLIVLLRKWSRRKVTVHGVLNTF